MTIKPNVIVAILMIASGTRYLSQSLRVCGVGGRDLRKQCDQRRAVQQPLQTRIHETRVACGARRGARWGGDEGDSVCRTRLGREGGPVSRVSEKVE